MFDQVLEENLDWEDVQWSQTGVWIAGKEYDACQGAFSISKLDVASCVSTNCRVTM